MKNIDCFRLYKKMIILLSSISVLLSFISYVLLLIYLLLNKHPLLLKTILIPLSTIMIVEVFRHFYHKQRPFEKYNYEPLIEHSTGKSFPSKHASSACIIALSIYQMNPTLGIIMILNAIVVGLTRIMSGIHYPIDVCGGYLLGFILHLFYYL